MIQARPSRGANRQAGTRKMKLHSVHALLKERAFVGQLVAGRSTYNFSYRPVQAATRGERLQLEGTLTITDPSGGQRSRDRVRATLVSTQGGLGSPPPRPSLPGLRQPKDEASRALAAKLAYTDNTGPTSFVGVMYLHFEPLDETALGVPADLSQLQLNARLAPTDDLGRQLHGVYSAVVEAIYGPGPRDESVTTALLDELNRLLAGG